MSSKYVMTDKHKENISVSLTGRTRAYSPNGEANPNWKGDAVGYNGVHKWVYKTLGKAHHCENCNIPAKRYEWSNISRKYKRDANDWQQLCTSCHKKYDMNDTIRANMSKAKKGVVLPYMNRPVEQYSVDGKKITSFKSILTAAMSTGVSNTSIQNNLSGRSRTAGGFVWMRTN